MLCICRQSFHYLEQFSSSIPNITTAVSLTKLLVILSERGQDFDNGMNTALGRLWFLLICCLYSNSSTKPIVFICSQYQRAFLPCLGNFLRRSNYNNFIVFLNFSWINREFPETWVAQIWWWKRKWSQIQWVTSVLAKVR